jgi:cholesterol transport system auxiliary component
MKTFPAIALSLLLLSGCSSLLPKGAPAAKLYTLNPPVIAAQQTSKIPYSVQVLIPQAAPGLDTDRIALHTKDNRIDYFADTKWAGSVPALTQALIVESFENSHRLKSVSNDLVATNHDYNLLIEVRDFQADYKESNDYPVIHVRMIAKIIRASDNDIISTISYNETAYANGNSLSEIIPSFEEASQKVINAIVIDTNKVLEHAQEPVQKSAPDKKA